MGIRLDWEIEAEAANVQQSGEDPSAIVRRRSAGLRLILFIAAVLACAGLILALIRWRISVVDGEIEQALRSTVEAEVAAIRLGDYAAFASVQQSASQEWLQQQTDQFYEYQNLKVQPDTVLSGEILEVKIDGRRGRILLQEIVEGIPYIRTWFYWRFDQGWGHVPPDFTFWGQSGEFAGERVSVSYHDLDEAFATSLGVTLDQWYQMGCAILSCSSLPKLQVQVIPQGASEPAWSPDEPWTLVLTSPYANRMRADNPFETSQRIQVATPLAERLVNMVTANLQPVYPADAYYLRQAVVSWLVGRLAAVNTNAFVIESLAAAHGESAVGRLAALLRPDSSVEVLLQAAGSTDAASAGLDWRDFVTWRLVTETELIRRQDEADFLRMYDTRDETSRSLAYRRYSDGPSEGQILVVSTRVETGTDGQTYLRATVEMGPPESASRAEALFVYADATWLRVN